MKISELKNFIYVAELGSFTQAADKLYISQQRLSYSIKKLEEHYGTQLLKRRPRVTLTKNGKSVLKFAKRVLNQDRQLVQCFKNSEKKENISLGIQEDQSINFLPYLISEMKDNYLNIQLSLIHNNSEKLERMVLDNEIQYATTINTHKREQLSVKKITDLNLYFMIPNKLLVKYQNLYGFKTNSKEVSLTDIFRIPIMLINGRQAEVIKTAFNNLGLKPNIAIEVNSGTIARNLLNYGEYSSIFTLLDNDVHPNFSSYKIVTKGEPLKEEIDFVFNERYEKKNLSKALYGEIKNLNNLYF